MWERSRVRFLLTPYLFVFMADSCIFFGPSYGYMYFAPVFVRSLPHSKRWTCNRPQPPNGPVIRVCLSDSFSPYDIENQVRAPESRGAEFSLSSLPLGPFQTQPMLAWRCCCDCLGRYSAKSHNNHQPLRYDDGSNKLETILRNVNIDGSF